MRLGGKGFGKNNSTVMQTFATSTPTLPQIFLVAILAHVLCPRLVSPYLHSAFVEMQFFRHWGPRWPPVETDRSTSAVTTSPVSWYDFTRLENIHRGNPSTESRYYSHLSHTSPLDITSIYPGYVLIRTAYSILVAATGPRRLQLLYIAAAFESL